MAIGIQYTSIEKLIDNFKDVGAPYYAITDITGNVLKRNVIDDNIDSAGDSLQAYFDNLDPINRSVFIIKHFSEIPDGGLKKKSEPDCISTFRKSEPGIKSDPAIIGNPNTINQFLLQELKDMRNELSELRREQYIFANEQDDQEIEPQTESNSLIGSLIGNPAIQNVLAQFLTNITANLVTPAANNIINPNVPRAMAGVDTLQSVIDVLYSKGVTFDDLKLLSQLPIEKIQLLLSMLRTNF